MKANELMIGDWIQRNGKNFQVTSIMDGYISTDEHSDSHDYHFNPIPLTPEILEKNGIKRKAINDEEPYYQDEEGYYYYQYGELGINTLHIWFWYKDGDIMMPSNCTKWIKLSFVHELQRVLRLCGLDELAENFIV